MVEFDDKFRFNVGREIAVKFSTLGYIKGANNDAITFRLFRSI